MMQPPGFEALTISESGQPILLVGSSVRAAAESACRAGFRPRAIDLFGDRQTRRASVSWHRVDQAFRESPSASLNAACAEPAPIAIVGGLDAAVNWGNLSEFSFWGATPEQFHECDSPLFLQELAAAAGVAFPETILLSERKSTSPWQRSRHERWLVKEPHRTGGLGVRQWDPKASYPHGSVAQRYCRGQIVGVTYLAHQGQALLIGACRLLRKRLGSLGHVFAGAVGPLSHSDALGQQLTRIGDALLKRMPIHGPFNVDVVVSGGKIHLLEVNPRWSASMELVERSWSMAMGQPCSLFSATDDWIRVAHGNGQRRVKSAYWKRIVFARRRIRVEADSLPMPVGDNWFWTDTPDEPVVVEAGQPVATQIGGAGRVAELA